MVVGAFPIAKLSVLLIKQISKPIANACKERAKHHPFFRTYVCMPPAQFYNWCEVKAKMWVLNLGRPVNIPVLSQEMAIELGANLLGESLIFIIGAGLLIIEYNRQSKKEAAKEESRLAEIKHITNTLTDLYFTVQQQQTQLKEMERLIYSISGKTITTPPPELKPPTLPPSLQPADKSPPAPPAAAPPAAPAPSATPPAAAPSHSDQMAKHNCDCIDYPTPYPNKGLILQSLNYIQMDVFSKFFSQSKSEEDEKRCEEKLKLKPKRENAIISEALYTIESNLRSLF